MTTPVLVVGDHFAEMGTAFAGIPSMPYDLAMATDLQACVVTHDHSARLCPPVALLRDALGADWSSGRIMVEFSEAITAQIQVTAETIAKLELQARFGTGQVYTWFGEVYVTPGYID